MYDPRNELKFFPTRTDPIGRAAIARDFALLNNDRIENAGGFDRSYAPMATPVSLLRAKVMRPGKLNIGLDTGFSGTIAKKEGE